MKLSLLGIFTALLLILALTPKAFPQDSALEDLLGNECYRSIDRFGAFQYHRFEDENKKCFLSIDLTDTPTDFRYRSYILTNEGTVMVFNSYSADEEGSSDGARVFTFFPRNQNPQAIDEGKGVTLVKTSTAGVDLIFDQTQARIVGMNGGEFSEDPQVNPNNRGGLEFKNANFLYLDSGFTMKKDPTSVASGISRFVDSKGNDCNVKNREVFKITLEGDSTFRFTDAELKAFLKNKCPQLTVNF